jgi:hypothetical protein
MSQGQNDTTITAVACLTTEQLYAELKAMTAEEVDEAISAITPIDHAWVIEVKVKKPLTCGDEDPYEWRALRTSAGAVYKYETENDAYRMGKLCYGIEADWRVTKL